MKTTAPRKCKTLSENSLAYKHIHFIQLLADYSRDPKQFKKLVNSSSLSEVNAITEIIINFLQGHIKCDTKKYTRYKKFLRFVGNKANSFKRRKKYLLSKGHGVIAPLLSIAIPALISLFGNK